MTISFPAFELVIEPVEVCIVLLYSGECEMFVQEGRRFVLKGCISQCKYALVFREMEKFGGLEDSIVMFEGSILLEEVFASNSRTMSLSLQRSAFGGGGVLAGKCMNFKVSIEQFHQIPPSLPSNASIGVHLKHLRLASSTLPKGPLFVEVYVCSSTGPEAVLVGKSAICIAQNRHSYKFDAFFRVRCEYFASFLQFEFHSYRDKKPIGFALVPASALVPFEQECLQINLHQKVNLQETFEKVAYNSSTDNYSCRSGISFSTINSTLETTFDSCIISFDCLWNSQGKEILKAFVLHPSDELFAMLLKEEVCEMEFWTPQLIQWLKETKCSNISLLFKVFRMEFLFAAFISILHSPNGRLLEAFPLNSLALSLVDSEFFGAQSAKYHSAIELPFTKHFGRLPTEFLHFLYCNLPPESKRKLEARLAVEFKVFDLLSESMKFSHWATKQRIGNFFADTTPLGRQLKVAFGSFSTAQQLAIQKVDSNYRLMAYTLLHCKSSGSLDDIWNAFQLFVKAEAFIEAQRLGERIIRLQSRSGGISPQGKASLYLELARISHSILLNPDDQSHSYSYYKIEFKGSGFPKTFNGTSLILERPTCTLLADIVAELTESFPHATIQSEDSDIYQSIKVISAIPLSDRTFQTKRPLNQPRIQIYYEQCSTQESFPNPYGLSAVKPEEGEAWGNHNQSLSPLECAIAVVREKNIQILHLIHQSKWPELKMVLFGCTCATVNGGLSEYRKKYLTPAYLKEHPKEQGSIQKLAVLCREHEGLIEQAEGEISERR